MDSACCEQEQTRPDQVKCAQHLRDPFSHFVWEKLFFFAIDQILLNFDVVGVAKPVRDHAEEESAEAEPANDESTYHSDPILQMTPTSLKCSRVHQPLADTEAESVAVNEDSWALEERTEED